MIYANGHSKASFMKTLFKMAWFFLSHSKTNIIGKLQIQNREYQQARKRKRASDTQSMPTGTAEECWMVLFFFLSRGRRLRNPPELGYWLLLDVNYHANRHRLASLLGRWEQTPSRSSSTEQQYTFYLWESCYYHNEAGKAVCDNSALWFNETRQCSRRSFLAWNHYLLQWKPVTSQGSITLSHRSQHTLPSWKHQSRL